MYLFTLIFLIGWLLSIWFTEILTLSSFWTILTTCDKLKKKKKLFKNFMAPFYGWGSTASRLEPLQGGSLLFTTKFPEISGTHFTDLGRMKGWVDPGATQWFWTRDPWIGNPAPWPLDHCSINVIRIVEIVLILSGQKG